MAHTLVAGNGDTLVVWALMLGPIITCLILGGITVATARWRSLPAHHKVRLSDYVRGYNDSARKLAAKS
jgi:hypothetical protein